MSFKLVYFLSLAETRLPDPASEFSSWQSMALEKMDRHPAVPPLPYMTSITSTRPTTVPSSSHTGSVKNRWSCITCNASKTDKSGDTASGFGVITCEIADERDMSFARTRVIMSLKVNTPTSTPLSTISEALRSCAIRIPASWIVDVGLTTVFGLPARTPRRVVIV